MKCETKNKSEIKEFIKFCKGLLVTEREDIYGTLVIDRSGITYTTESGKGVYHMIDEDLNFSGRRRSFSDGVCYVEYPFHPNYKKWTITETSMPELPLGDINYSYKSDEEYEEEKKDENKDEEEIDWKAYVSYPEPEK
jgi:hypothetical protein